MSLALYRKYRSKSLEEVVGQEHITSILTNAISSGRISHAYLFTGPRGVGKTSVARILAHALNNLDYTDESSHLDIIEIDAASNNGVEDVRDLREKVQLAPVSAAKKVYIIDEVHMLSKPAFNALLKTLEEPPQHVVFILATTDVEKLPDTIVSRTQRYSFKNIAEADAIKHLSGIAKKEKIDITDEAIALIARRGDGSFRDSISLLDQISNLTDGKAPITVELIESLLGLASGSIIDSLIQATEQGDIATISSTLKQASDDGINPLTLTEQLTIELREAAIDKPHLLTLLDSLLDVSKSSHPQLKLLAVLGSAALTNAKPDKKTPPKSVPLSVPTPPHIELDDTKNSLSNNLFDWQKVLDHTKENEVTIYGLIKNCGHAYDGDTLTIYTGNSFTKKRLDDSKYKQLLLKSLKQACGFQPSIHTVPTAAPLKNSQAASIAAIMGGGEEVSLET